MAIAFIIVILRIVDACDRLHCRLYSAAPRTRTWIIFFLRPALLCLIDGDKPDLLERDATEKCLLVCSFSQLFTHSSFGVIIIIIIVISMWMVGGCCCLQHCEWAHTN